MEEILLEYFKNHFFAIITCSKEYYENITQYNQTIYNPQHRERWFKGVSYDPFENADEKTATIVGVPTLVYKQDNIYYDLIYSMIGNELSYQMNLENEKGITLKNVEYFLDWNCEIVPQFMMQWIGVPLGIIDPNNLPYFFSWDPFTERWDININDEEYLYLFYDNYVNSNFLVEEENNQKEINRKILEHYYVGVITVKEECYTSQKIIHRYHYDESYNPFEKLSKEQATRKGVPTLLYKKGDSYYDILHERFPNELKYQLHAHNHMGIYLEDVEPFTNTYPTLPYPICMSGEDVVNSCSSAFSPPYVLYRAKDYDYALIALCDKKPLERYHKDWVEKNKEKIYRKDRP